MLTDKEAKALEAVASEMLEESDECGIGRLEAMRRWEASPGRQVSGPSCVSPALAVAAATLGHAALERYRAEEERRLAAELEAQPPDACMLH